MYVMEKYKETSLNKHQNCSKVFFSKQAQTFYYGLNRIWDVIFVIALRKAEYFLLDAVHALFENHDITG